MGYVGIWMNVNRRIFGNSVHGIHTVTVVSSESLLTVSAGHPLPRGFMLDPALSPASDPTYSSSTCVPRGGQQQPHILMVVVDDAGFNDFGISMSNQFSTPVIDRLANNGILLNNHYTMPLVSANRPGVHEAR